jgi:DNA-binding transcriptional ArsR family regulator
MNGETVRTAVAVLLAATLAVQAGFAPAPDSHAASPDDGGPALATVDPAAGTAVDGGAPFASLDPGAGTAVDAEVGWGASVVPATDLPFAGTVPSAATLVEEVRETAGTLRPAAVLAEPPTLLVVAGRLDESDEDLLANDVRRSLYDAVRDRPGRSVAGHAEALGVSASTVRYHVRVLERADGVRTERDRGRRRLFPTEFARGGAGTGDALAAALADEAAASVLRAVERRGPAPVSDVARATDRAVSTVSHHLDRLEADGLIERERRGRHVLVSLTEGAVAGLDAD